jgi:hypothetical protein
MSDFQKRLCPTCGQSNDYSNSTCSFCASPLLETEGPEAASAEAVSAEAVSPAPAAPEQARGPGLTNKELQSITVWERSKMPSSNGNKKELRFLLAAVVLGPILFIALLALLGGLAKLSDIWRVGG